MTDKLVILTADQYTEQLRQAAHMGASIALAEFAQSGGAQKAVLSLNEAADFLHIGRSTFRAYVTAGDVPHFKVGRVLKFRRADLAKWEPPVRVFSDEKTANGMSTKGKTLKISAPSIFGMFDIFSYRKWTLRFLCGKCGAKPTVQHDEVKNWHKCPVCGEVNILDKTSYYEQF